MKYLFRNALDGQTREIECSMFDIEDRGKALALAGWHRVYTVPQFYIQWGMTEYMEESEKEAENNDRQGAMLAVESQAELSEAIRNG